jgi:hypothetical protein
VSDDLPAMFLDPLRSEDLDGAERFRLLERLRYRSKVLDREIELEAGFECDSYSSPRTFFGSWIVRGIDRRPAFLHDKLYASGICTRKEADLALLEAMESVGISWWRRKAIYRGVRLGGGLFWEHDDEGELDEHVQEESP